MAILKLSTTERRRVSVFFTCLVLAVVAWVAVSLSSPYQYTIKEIIRFKNAPLRRAFHPLQSDTVDVTVRGTGWQMLFSKMNDENKIISVDLSDLEHRSYLALHRQLMQINADKPFKYPIVAFDPDTLYFDFSNRRVRKIPVKLSSAIQYQKQYGQSGKVVIKPAYVTVSGPSSRIDKIDAWYTDTVTAKNVNSSVITNVTLRPSTEGNISIYPKSVNVRIPVDEFTEKTIEVPVKVTENHDYYRVKLFPQKVKITFTTSLGQYSEMNEDLFEARASLDLWRKYGYSNLPVKITNIPSYCKVVKIEPQNVDFIIKK